MDSLTLFRRRTSLSSSPSIDDEKDSEYRSHIKQHRDELGRAEAILAQILLDSGYLDIKPFKALP
jgi:hypothetical protein